MSSSSRPTSSTDGTTGGKGAEEKPAAGAGAPASHQGGAARDGGHRPADPRTPAARPDGNRTTDPRAPESKSPEDDGFEDTRTVLVRSKPSAPRPAAEVQKATPNAPVKHEGKAPDVRQPDPRQQQSRPQEHRHHEARGMAAPHGGGDIGDTLTLVIKPIPAPSATQAAQDAKAALNAIIAAADARSPLVEPEPEPQPELELELPDAKRRPGRHRRRANRWRTFFFILWRDIFVTGREMGPFLGQVIVEPFFMLFVFGKVLGEIGFTQPGFQQVLLPGVVALNSFLVALQNTALPLAIDFSWTKEIEDRLLAPIPVSLVAVEKAIFGAMRGLIGSLVMIPIGLALLDDVSWPLEKMPVTLGILSLGGLVGGCVGLTLGTLAPARHISIVFAMTLTPIMFTGATQFPWRSLEGVRWFQILCSFNPLTYVTEAMRGLLLEPGPKVPESIPLWICFSAIGAAILIFGTIGIRGFNRRAQD
ncbi:ABC transporter permease [Streptomyces antimycoticus]|uniref:ABC transporter permease n=2 Tax=Streptomyces TaxID=1883 RepID=A0ABD5J2S2_9ACTN|nr:MULTISPECIES: ABC transporter permease [Streptomyces]MEE4582638.1 ABC transporter permease [Streptomyces sp. DSM 41602]WJD99508.1 ABC transporter permease [Streptomyces antimycoticus]WTA81676.1 ABC transporter permease [Streptomyces antimycoticus]WTB07852.1 ABC transporter permease [Streptomyces antimycoticus]